MAAARTYTITSIVHTGDSAIVSGTVDTIPSTGPIEVSIACNYSSITSQPNIAAVQAFVAPLFLAASAPPQPITVTTFNGSWNA